MKRFLLFGLFMMVLNAVDAQGVIEKEEIGHLGSINDDTQLIPDKDFVKKKSKKNLTSITNEAYTVKISDITYNILNDKIEITKFLEDDYTNIIIPESFEIDGKEYKVVTLGRFSFYFKGIVSVQFPETIETIKYASFADNSLSSIELPNTLKNIEEFAFENNAISEVVFPNSIDSIGGYSFRYNNLESLEIPNKHMFIGRGAFNGNKIKQINDKSSDGLIFAKNSNGDWDETRIVSYGGESDIIDFIPNTATNLANGAFYGNEILYVDIPNSVKTIGISTFNNNLLTSVILPKSIERIDNFAFYNNSLINVSLLSSLDTLHVSVFRDNKLSRFEIPNTVTFIGENALRGNNLSSISIPNSVNKIDYGAFADNSLEELEIPNTVTYIGDYVFQNNLIEGLIIPNSVTHLGVASFRNNKITSINNKPSKGFVYQKNTDGSWDESSINSYGGISDDIDFIPNTVITLSESSFYECGLKSVSFPTSVQKIERWAFGWNELTTLKLPDEIENVAEYSFYNNIINELDFSKSLNSIEEGAFAFNELTKVIVPNNIEYIGHSSFRSNNISTLEFYHSARVIDSLAFAYNDILEVYPPGSAIQINYCAFYGNICKTFYLPKSPFSFDCNWGNGYSSFDEVSVEGEYQILGCKSIYYELNGGFLGGAPETFFFPIHGIPYLYAAEKKGDKFLGWYTNADFTSEPITSIPKWTYNDVTLYAKWQSSLSVNEDEASRLVIYPQPAKDKLNVKGVDSGKQISVYSYSGQLLISEIYKGDAIDVSMLKAGVYVLDCGSEGRVRFVKG